jgi:hypothetical protein
VVEGRVVDAAAVVDGARVVVGSLAGALDTLSRDWPGTVSLASSSSSPHAASPPTPSNNALLATTTRIPRSRAPRRLASSRSATASAWWFDIT